MKSATDMLSLNALQRLLKPLETTELLGALLRATLDSYFQMQVFAALCSLSSTIDRDQLRLWRVSGFAREPLLWH